MAEIKSLSTPVQAYGTLAAQTKEYGFKAEKNSNKEEKKKYLKQLRRLQKKYDTLALLLQKKLSKTIVEDNYVLFSNMVSSDAALFF